MKDDVNLNDIGLKILDTYFKTNDHFVTQHHIDSYNHFITNRIPMIIKSLNPVTMIKPYEDDKDVIKHKVDVFVGGESGNLVYFDKPTIVDPDSGEQRLMFPNEARLFDYSYVSDVYADVLVRYTYNYRKGVDVDTKELEELCIDLKGALRKAGAADAGEEGSAVKGITDDVDGGKRAVERVAKWLSENQGASKRECTTKYNELVKLVFPDGERVDENVLTRVKIGTIPIMLHSRLCALYGQPFGVRREMGECPYDQGGYFIVDGKEKVCVAQERNLTNSLFVSKSRDDNYSYEAFLRCTSEESSVFPKTMRFYVVDKKLQSDKADNARKHLQRMDRLSRHNAIVVTVPHIDAKIPLFALFRLLGVESDRDIIESVLMLERDERNRERMMDFLRASVADANFAYSQELVAKYLKNHVAHKTEENLYFVLKRNLFPNLEDADNYTKARYLAYVVWELVKVCLGLAPETDRDNYMFKRIGISGFLLGDIFKDYYNSFRVNLRNVLDREYEYKHWRLFGNLDGKINAANKGDLFKESIIREGMIKSIKGKWGPGGAQGIVQDLNRISYIGFLSHLRRVNTPMDPSIKLRRPHQLTTSQYGMVCPSESPDGGSIGLLKNFAITCFVSFDTGTAAIKQALEPFRVVYLDQMTPYDARDSVVLMFNNTWVGVVASEDAPRLVRWIRLLRRNSLINNLISVSWNVIQRRINILTDNGRCTRPLLIVNERGGLALAEALKGGERFEDWHDYIRGRALDKKAYNFYFDGYHDPWKTVGLSRGESSIEEVMERLEETAAVIEFMDVEETNGAYIAMNPRDLGVALGRYTHCEIHPSCMFSIYSVSIPFPNHNAAPRVVFSGAQGKQAVGVYATNFNNRIDTMGYVLHYPQKPMVKTRFRDYMNSTQLPNGENLIVAVCTYTGYNQEDSIIVNKRSIERGMFNLTYYKAYGAEESGGAVGPGDGKGERVIFTNKNLLAAMGEEFAVRPARYDKLDENGLPVVGALIKEGDAYLGRYGIEEVIEGGGGDEDGEGGIVRKRYVDRSLVADKTVGGIIDKVLVFKNKNGEREVKIRMRKVRTPELGDKMASFHGQKGVCGLIMPAEDMPFNKDGMVPDIIINPHAFPTRMTFGHMIECVFGKACVMDGFEYDAMPFEKHDFESVYKILEDKHDLQRYGDEILYNGRSGDQMNTEIFFGPTYYQRLKHMVADKINYRTTGRIMGLTKQPTKGRSNEGGLRIGEMETNCIISHGMSSFIKEAFFERSDKYEFYKEPEGNSLSGKNRFAKRIMAPYAFKLLTQELQTMGIDPVMIMDTDFDQVDKVEDGVEFAALPEVDDDDEIEEGAFEF